MLRVTITRGSFVLTRLILLVTSTAFAILLLVASSHLHLVPQDNNGCFVCTALEDKVHEFDRPHAARLVLVVYLVVAALRLGVLPTLTPPSCGPPAIA